jgi:hypothetical protein
MKSETITWAGHVSATGEMTNAHTEKVWWDNLERDLGADRRILLKCISNITG